MDVFPFLMFPREIQLRILLYLKAPDVFRFREVCKTFSELANDVAVEYSVQLDTTGMVDNPSHGSSLIERHEKLLRYQGGWKEATPSVDPNVPVRIVRDFDSGSYWEWTGGVFPYVVNLPSSQQTLHLYRPGSSVRGLETRRWTVGTGSLPGGHKMLGCGIDKAQNLLVLSLVPMRYNPDNEGAYILQLMSLQRAGAPHPSASRPLLCGSRLRMNKPWPEIRPPQICGDILAYGIQNDVWEVEAWNWKTGTLLLRFQPSDSFHGFALLSQSCILISDGVGVIRNEMALKVYWIDPKISLDPRSRPQRRNPDLVLKLMPLAAGVDCLTWLSHYPETTSPDGIPPFTYNDDLSVFALFFHFQFYRASLPHSHPPPNFLLLVSVRELLRILDLLRSSESIDVPQAPHRNLRIEWDAWGPSATRLITFKYPIWNTMPPVSRTRCAVAIRGTARDDPHFNYVLLLSAHPHAALSNRGSPGAHVTDSDVEGGEPQRDEDREEAAMVAEFVICEDAILCPKIFRTSVRTTLPVSVRCKRVPRPHGPEVAEHAEIGLFEDGLSLMYLYEADGAMRWDTFTFSV